MRDSERMEYNRPPPKSTLWEGCDVDDRCLIFSLPKSRLHCHAGHNCEICRHPEGDKGLLKDTERIEASRQAYRDAGLSRSEGKTFDCEQRFEIWGTSVDIQVE